MYKRFTNKGFYAKAIASDNCVEAGRTYFLIPEEIDANLNGNYKKCITVLINDLCDSIICRIYNSEYFYKMFNADFCKLFD